MTENLHRLGRFKALAAVVIGLIFLAFSAGAESSADWREWLWADLNDTGQLRDAVRREAELLAKLDELANRSELLVLETTSLCREFSKLLEASDLSASNRAQLQLQLDAVRAAAAKVAILTGNTHAPAGLENGRIIAISPELGAAAINLGSLHGLFDGMVLRTLQSPEQELRVIAVRPEVCAAVPVDRNLAGLTVGMPVSAAMLHPGTEKK